MTAELQDKKLAKYDPKLQAHAVAWMEAVTGESLGLSVSAGAKEFHEALKDGVCLCKLINVLQPGSVKRINSSKMAFKMMENIGNFLSSCENYGLLKTDLFQTVDLYEAQNIPQVINAIHAIGRKATSKSPSLPALGPKEASKNVRQFDEETMQAGKAVIGLQMGTNRGASQSGMTPAGLGRQIHNVNLKGVQ